MNKPVYLLLFAVMLLGVAGSAQAQQTQFGGAVAIGDDEVFVGEAQNTTSAGTVFVYRRDAADDTWKEHARLSASDADPSWDDRFGRAMASDGTTLVVGATKRGGTLGGVYFFEPNDAGAWTEVAHFAAEDGAADDHLGRVIAISDGFAFVSSLGHNESSGAVYVYHRNPDTGWGFHSKLVGSDLQPGDYFGMAIALDGHKALISAPSRNEQTGAVYAFHYDEASMTWTAAGTLEVEGLESGHSLGSSLSMKGDYAFIGSPRYGGNLGAAYVYRYDSGSKAWMQQTRLEPSDGDQGRLGMSMAASGNEVWVGAPGASGMQGAAYLYQRNGDSWAETKKLVSEELQRGDFFSGAMAINGNLAAVGITGASHGMGEVAIFERNGASGAWMEAGRVFNEKAGMASIVGGQVDCANGTADQFECEQVDLVSFLSVQDIGGDRGVRTNDVWGWTDPQTDKEYALVGRMDGTAFVDISDPYNPAYLGSLPMTEGSIPNSWRDMKVYNNHAYIVADGAGEHGMQVFDLTQLRNVANPPAMFKETAIYDGIHSAHNIVINEASGFAFAVGSSGGGKTCGGGLHMIDIRQPAEPTFAGCFSDSDTGRQGTGYSHDAQCVIYDGPDAEHQGKEICFGSNETALSVADVTDKENPVALSNASYPNVGYSHQGWLTEDHRYFYMNDELDELNGKVDGTRTLVWDVMDLDDPQLVTEYYSESKASDHNLYIKDNLMYQSNYLSGLRIFDISDIDNPVEVAHFDTVPYGENGPGFGGSWSNYPYFKSGVLVVTSMSEGVFFLKKRSVDI